MKSNNDNAKRQKVCYLIKVNGKGTGGHYRSLKTTVEALSEKIDPLVINIGPRTSPIFDNLATPVLFVPFTASRLLGAMRKLSTILKQERPDVICSYDTSAHFFARTMGALHGLPVVHTKCGGASPQRYYPLSDNIVVFSPENQGFFQSQRRFRHSSIHLIPNRVKPFACDPVKVQNLRKRLDDNLPCFLRINRISPMYKKGMMQSINLVKRLNNDKHPCQLLIVGNAEDPELVKELRNSSNDNIHTVTDDIFTLNAREIIDAADFVIGTGRGFMEAASRGKILMTPMHAQDAPLLISPENFQQVFHTNFSPRNQVEQYDPEENYQAIARTIDKQDERKRLQKESREYFERYFNIDNVIDTYTEIYRNATKARGFHPIDATLNAYLCLLHAFRTRSLE